MKKKQIAAQIQQKNENNASDIKYRSPRDRFANNPKKPTRYIPVKIKKLLIKEYGTKCSKETCNRRAVQIHHMNYFSLTGNHNPHYLKPLCRAHHELEHENDHHYHKFRHLALTG